MTMNNFYNKNNNSQFSIFNSQLIVTPLKKIYHPKGNIFHALKKSETTFNNFGEAYFSFINYKEIKGWKKHTRMTLNLVVPVGKIKFVVFNEKSNNFFEIVLSIENYQRLTVKPGLWFAFQGLEKNCNLVLNIANIEHEPTESENKNLEDINYNWD